MSLSEPMYSTGGGLNQINYKSTQIKCFRRDWKTRVPGEKPLRAEYRTHTSHPSS